MSISSTAGFSTIAVTKNDSGPVFSSQEELFALPFSNLSPCPHIDRNPEIEIGGL